MIIIDGIQYDVPVLGINRKAEFLDKYAERTEDGVLHRELIGVYYNYQLKFGTVSNRVLYKQLWDKLSEPTEFHSVSVIDTDGGEYTFQAYFSNVADEYRMIVPNPDFGLPGENEFISYFKNLTVNFIAQSPART